LQKALAGPRVRYRRRVKRSVQLRELLATAVLDVWRLQMVLPQHPVCSSRYHQAGMFRRLPSCESQAFDLQRELPMDLLLLLMQTTH
jgi:hypothetical protein